MIGELFVIYTTEVGGYYKVRKTTSDEYEVAVRSGKWDETPPDVDCPRGRDMVDLKMIALLRVEDDFDFVLGRSRSV